MCRRIAVLMKVAPASNAGQHSLQVKDVERLSQLSLPRGSFVLTLQIESDEPHATFSHGHLHSLDDDVKYPIRSNRSFYDALRAFVDRAGQEA